jgi:hypothetical protein
LPWVQTPGKQKKTSPGTFLWSFPWQKTLEKYKEYRGFTFYLLNSGHWTKYWKLNLN